VDQDQKSNGGYGVVLKKTLLGLGLLLGTPLACLLAGLCKLLGVGLRKAKEAYDTGN